jgi:predicted permease
MESQLDAELRDHFERLVADFEREGLSAPEARRRARLEFGGVEQIKELCRDARGTRWLEELAQDVRYGCRGFRKNFGFTIVVVLTLALGVGASMAVFNLIDAMLLRPLPVANANELVTLIRFQRGESSEHFSYPQVRLLADRSELFSTLAGIGSDVVNVGPQDALEPTAAAWVSGGHFQTMGIVPIAGRLLNASDDQPGAQAVAVITHNYWTRRLGADANAVGRSLLVEGASVPIVGITPRGFTGATIGEFADITLAICARASLQPERSFVGPDSRWLRILARPQSGLSQQQLQAKLDVAWPQVLGATVPPSLSQDSRARMLSTTLVVESGATGTGPMRTQFRRPLVVAMVLVTFALVIACVNVANLLFARGATRAREIALRLALGAGRRRIVQQLLTESALLTIVGTAVGVALAAIGSQALLAVIANGFNGPDASAVMLDMTVDWRLASVAIGVAAATTLLCGVAPAWRASLTARRALSASSSRVTGSHGRLGAALIVTQVALSLALVVGAGLFARTLHNLRGLDRGFRSDNVLLVGFDPTRAGYSSPELVSFNQLILTTVERLPGVRAASIAAVTPLEGGGMSQSMVINGVSTGLEDVYFNVIGPRYFELMSTALLTGREFSASDDHNAPGVAIVNHAFARRYFSQQSPLGQRVALRGSPREMQIIAVVADAVYETLRAPAPPTVYVSFLQHRGRPMTLVIDAPGSHAAAIEAIRAQIQPKVPTQPLRFRTLAAQIEGSLVRERLMVLLTMVVGALALTLAAVGLYGLISYAVTTRTREIGVRLALGARQSVIQWGVLATALRMVAVGIVIGLPISWMLSRLLATLIYGVTPTDPATVATAIAVLVLVGLLAAMVPARHAARVDPMLSLRAE